MAVPLLARFPTFRAPTASASVIPVDQRGDYPALAEDFAVIDRDLAPSFAECDLAARRHQNRYRRQQVIIVLGSTLVSALGGTQAALAQQRWPGVLLTLLGAALAITTRLTDEQSAQTGYLAERVKAERLRALHFRYLSRTGRYAGPDRETALRRAVLAVKAGREPE
jgi:hypothetical protein